MLNGMSFALRSPRRCTPVPQGFYDGILMQASAITQHCPANSEPSLLRYRMIQAQPCQAESLWGQRGDIEQLECWNYWSHQSKKLDEVKVAIPISPAHHLTLPVTLPGHRTPVLPHAGKCQKRKYSQSGVI